MFKPLRQLGKKVAHNVFGIPVRINGVEVKLPAELLRLFTLRRDNGYEHEVADLFQSVLREGDVFIDVGANVGMLSLTAARIVGETGRESGGK